MLTWSGLRQELNPDADNIYSKPTNDIDFYFGAWEEEELGQARY